MIRKNSHYTTLLLISLIVVSGFQPELFSQNVFRFEYIGTENGLSQNTGSSILFDSKGFMWIGTMNGLNRYDGYEFRIFKGQSATARNITNNRVNRVWEDRKGFIWAETYDGYYHYFNPETEVFLTIPDYEENVAKYFRINSFLQYNDETIILGSNSGVFILHYDIRQGVYRVSQYPDKGSHPLSNNNVRFVHADEKGNLWIGTERGINFITREGVINENAGFQHLFVSASFNSVCEDRNEVWFGTDDAGIVVYNKNNQKFSHLKSADQPEFPSDHICMLWYSGRGHYIVGFNGGTVLIASERKFSWKAIPFHGNRLGSVYEDLRGQMWLTAEEFGVTRVDPVSLNARYYELTPQEMQHLTDLERPQFFEDRNEHLWIGLHGGGLALYERENDRFRFYRNDPGNPNSISSNIIHSIAEDNSGQMWLGTGQFLGGVEKVILENKAFTHILPEGELAEMVDNVVRGIYEDKNGMLWVATKGGRLYLYDSLLVKQKTLESLPGIGTESFRNNTYAIFHDSRDYIWAGSKGDGLSVTTGPVSPEDYGNLKFKRYRYTPADTMTLGSDNIYSITEDHSGRIWIGTYGNGVTLITDPHGSNRRFTRINQQNSNLSGNLVRNVLVDSRGGLWVATTLGLNYLPEGRIGSGNFDFVRFFRDPKNTNTISYNDIVQIFEDSKHRIWLGTFGAGVDLLETNDGKSFSFRHFTTANGLSSDVIFGILEDNDGYIWLSTENGLTRLDPNSGEAVIYNTNNGLYFSNFSENTCYKRHDGVLCFGGYRGFELVDPDLLTPETVIPRMELTSFQLFNKEVPVNQEGSPLSRNISFTGDITLKYKQNSFSVGFSALNFIDPLKVNYMYILENFEDEWNFVGDQHKATYTNLSPGRYVFRVKSLTSNQTTGSDERLLTIRIQPPWWRTVPAYITYLFLLTVLSVSVYKTVSRINRYRNELQVEKKVNELKLQFFTNISHEIRTPLTLIISPIEDILSTHGISNHNRTLMEIIHKNARRMLQLTTQLLDFRKIQNNRMILRVGKIDMVSFTREIYKSFIPLAQHKGMDYSFKSSTESFYIYGDPAKLDTVVYNIISNAIKFTGQAKSVSVSIDDQAEKEFLLISVTDQGPGIPEKNLSDIFTRYTILSNQDFAGTGIGLSLAYELARLHKGDILISSVEGEGSTFTVKLPKSMPDYGDNAVLVSDTEIQGKLVIKHQVVEAEETSGDLAETAAVAGPGRKQTLLIVEDNPEILNYVSQAMQSAFTCMGARNGEEGLHLAATMNPDIIITDIMMPGMDGLEMTKRLKEDFNTSHIPVIMLTSKTAMNDQITGIETGAEAYIVKPFRMEYLKAVTRNLLSQRNKVMMRLVGRRDVEVGPVKVASRDEEFLGRVVQFVEENYENDFQIDSLAEYCCVGRTVFYNKVKGLTGLGPLEFVRKIKLTIASQLLEKGYNVSEAAYKTGFSDVKYFSRQFKALYGFSPSKQPFKIVQNGSN